MKTPAPYAVRVPAHVADLIRGLHPQIKRKLRAEFEKWGKVIRDAGIRLE